MHLLYLPRSLCAVGLLFCLISGCGQQIYRAETTLEPDGQISRAIYQPVDDTPVEALAPAAWSGVTYASQIDNDAWTGKIDQLPLAERDRDHEYFAAWGRFASPAKVPATYFKTAPPGLPNGKLVVQYAQNDYIFVTEYDWRETLTDIVSLDDMRRGRRQFLEVVIPLLRKCLETGLGNEYDVDGVVEWLNTTGSDWFVELTDAFFEAGTRDQLPPNTGWKETLADVCGRYGLKLRDANGRVFDDDRARKQVAEFAGEILKQRLKRRDGRPLSQTTVDDLLEWVNLIDPPQSQNPRLARLDGVAQKVIEAQFGSQEEFAGLIRPLAARMLGLYRMEILGPPRRFHYQMQLPGSIVETNGTLLGGDKVLWTFEAVQAYPYGYEMRARALAPNAAVQQAFLNSEPLTSQADMLAYLNAMNSDFMLGEALRMCVKKKSIDPLYAARVRTVTEDGNTRPYDTVLRLLKLPAAPESPTPQ